MQTVIQTLIHLLIAVGVVATYAGIIYGLAVWCDAKEPK